MKGILKIPILLIFLILALPLIASAPQSPISLTLTSDTENLKLNQEFSIEIKLISSKTFDDVSLNIFLPKGIQSMEPLNFKTNLDKDSQKTFKLKLTSTGYTKGEIIAIAEKTYTENNYFGGKDTLYIDISKDIGIIKEEPLPLSEKEKSSTASLLYEIPETIKKETKIKNIPEPISYSKKSNLPQLDGGTVTLKATFFYKDRNDSTKPLEWVTVEAWDKDLNSSDDFLGFALADKNGDFVLGPINNVDEENGTQDIYFIFIARSSSAEVSTPETGRVFNSSTPINWDVPDGLFNAGSFLAPTTPVQKPAWWVYEDLIYGWNYIANVAQPSFLMPKQRLTWSYRSNAGTYYVHGGPIRLLAGHANDPDAVFHEYGHAVMFRVYRNYMPTTPNCNMHFITDSSSVGCAWVEGWADLFPLIIQNDSVYSDSTYWFSVDMETRTPYTPWDLGDDVEGNVAASLWDAFDSTNEDRDTLNGGLPKIWPTFRNNKHNIFSEYWNSWKLDNHLDKLAGCNILSLNTINYCSLLRISEIPKIGNTINLTLNGPPGQQYILGLSTGNSPGTILGNLTVPLNYGPLLETTLKNPTAFLKNSIGTFDKTGSAIVQLIIPNIPELDNQTIHSAFVIYDPYNKDPFTDVSNGIQFKIEK